MIDNQFQQATYNLLRAIDCPCFADENRAAVQQFLYKFAEHIMTESFKAYEISAFMKHYRLNIDYVLSNMADMPKEQR